MIEVQTLSSVEAAALAGHAPALFACLAARPAAVRARAAQTLLQARARGTRFRGELARDFGSQPDAVVSPLFAELAAVIGWEPSPAWPKFLASLVIGMEEWREGIGYDLEALAALHPEEQSIIRQWLRSRLTDPSHAIDWRELEAVHQLGDRELLGELAGHSDREVRLRVKGMQGDRESIEDELCQALREAKTLGELVRAKAFLNDYATPKVKAALVERVKRNDQFFITLAMTLLDVFTSADSWAERPGLFQIQEQAPTAR